MSFSLEIQDEELTALGIEAESAFAKYIAVDKLSLGYLTASTVGFDEPVFNVVIDSKTAAVSLPARIKQASEFFHKHQVTWTWLVHPLSQPANLASLLKKEGFELFESIPGMYFNLTELKPAPHIPDLKIEETDAKNNLSDWIIPISNAFPGDDNGEEYRKLFDRLPKGKTSPLKHYVGYYQKQPVVAMTLFIHQNTVSVYNLGTHKNYRGLGLGSALTLYALHQARELGFKHCFLASSEKGFNVYRRLGFKIYMVWEVYIRRMEEG